MDVNAWSNVFYMHREFKEQSKCAQWYPSTPPETQVHNIQPGGEVLIKAFFRKSKDFPKEKVHVLFYYVPSLLLKI